MAESLVPKTSTLHSSRIPEFSNSTAIFKPVCPPKVGKSASGRSLRIILETNSSEIGSIYTLSAISTSVIIVAGLELMRITL